MKQIKLLQLTLQNFKGIKSFRFEPQGQSVTVAGANGSGKTSLPDGQDWLYFGKDSHGNTDFQIKPLENGKEVHGIETTVEAVLDVDGESVTLTKAYKEIWRKKRGSKDKEFDGHTTEYFFDAVPLKKGEFQNRIAEICDERTFRLLTSVTYFNAVLHWQDRRGVVIDVSGDVSTADVIARHGGIAELPEIIGKPDFDDRTFEDFKAKIKSQRKEANKRLEELPVRIDEAEKSKPELPALTMGLDHLRKDLKAAQDKRAAMLAGDTKHLRDHIAELEKQKKDIEDRNEQTTKAEIRTVEELRAQWQAKDREMQAYINEIDDLDKQINANNKKLDELRAEFREIDAEVWDGTEFCSLCGQVLPDSKREQARANFNNSKAERKAANQQEGKALAQKNKELEDRKSGLVDRVAVLDQEIDVLNKELENRPELELESTAIIERQIHEINRQIEYAATPDTQEIDAEINRLETNIEEAEQRKTIMSQIENTDNRIKELQAEQKSLAKKIEEYDKHIYMCEEYTKARVSMLESLVADKFAPYSFKMFEQQINGGISDTCELLRDGKPYSALSTGEKIAAGLHVIEVLSEYYGISAPVFIDNAESLTLPVRSDLHQQFFLKAEDGQEELVVRQDHEEVAV